MLKHKQAAAPLFLKVSLSRILSLSFSLSLSLSLSHSHSLCLSLSPVFLKVSASLSANVGKMKLRQIEIKTNSLKRNGRKKVQNFQNTNFTWLISSFNFQLFKNICSQKYKFLALLTFKHPTN